MGPIVSTETCPEEDEFGAAVEDKDDYQEDDEVFSSDSPEPSEDEQSSRQSQNSLKISPEESLKDSPQESPKPLIKSSVSFKDAGNLRSSLCKRISTPLPGKRLFLIRN